MIKLNLQKFADPTPEENYKSYLGVIATEIARLGANLGTSKPTTPMTIKTMSEEIAKLDITNLTAANVKTGVTILGVAGTFTADADAAAGDILSSKTAYVKGSKVTGTLALTGNAIAANVLEGKTFYNTDAKTKVTGTIPTYSGSTNVTSSTTLPTKNTYVDEDIVVDVNVTVSSLTLAKENIGTTVNHIDGELGYSSVVVPASAFVAPTATGEARSVINSKISADQTFTAPAASMGFADFTVKAIPTQNLTVTSAMAGNSVNSSDTSVYGKITAAPLATAGVIGADGPVITPTAAVQSFELDGTTLGFNNFKVAAAAIEANKEAAPSLSDQVIATTEDTNKYLGMKQVTIRAITKADISTKLQDHADVTPTRADQAITVDSTHWGLNGFTVKAAKITTAKTVTKDSILAGAQTVSPTAGDLGIESVEIPQIKLESKGTITLTDTSEAPIAPGKGFDGIKSVTVKIDAANVANLKPENILHGVTILGVTGTLYADYDYLLNQSYPSSN